MKSSVDVRVRIPLADIVDAMADEVAREVERQVAPFVRLPKGTAGINAPNPANPLSLEAAVDAVVQAVTRVDNSMHGKDEKPALQALYKAAIALRRVRKEHLKKEK